jgi:hypothetical protein
LELRWRVMRKYRKPGKSSRTATCKVAVREAGLGVDLLGGFST